MTLIKDDDNLLGTHKPLKLKYILLISICNGPPLKRCKTEAADSRYAKASRGRTKKDKDLEDSNTSSNTQLDSPLDSDDYCLDSSLDINPKDDSEDEEATTAKDLAREQKERLKALLNAKDGLSARVETAIEHYAYILYFKELLSNNSGIFANAIGIGKTRAIIEVQNAQAESNAIEYNAVNDNDKLYSTKGERTFYCADSPLENIGRPTKEEAIEMRIDTTNAISKALAAANKLVALQSYVLEGGKLISGIKGNFLPYFQSCLCLDFLSTVQNANRRIIFNYFKMQAIASYSALATLKAAQFKIYSSCKVKRFTLNSIKDLFTNLSKDYFLVQEARTITKSSLKFQNLSNLCSKLAEMCVSIVYFNLDSELELKVLGKQDVKTTS
ncbi:hypothetical protein HBH78_180950 [Parastagonospora nodorum]|nr:hypothetical protein HBH78_180950 [Parastagonospora nodorum]